MDQFEQIAKQYESEIDQIIKTMRNDVVDIETLKQPQQTKPQPEQIKPQEKKEYEEEEIILPNQNGVKVRMQEEVPTDYSQTEEVPYELSE